MNYFMTLMTGYPQTGITCNPMAPNISNNHFLTNPFKPNVPFLYPLKMSGNLWFSEVFKGYRNGILG